MQGVFNISAFISIVTVVLCFVAGLVLMVFSKSNSVNNKWLAGYFLAIGYGILIAFLLYSKLIFNFPWYNTYRTGYIAGFLLMPFSFFYIRSLIQQKKFTVPDLVHFIPVVLFIIDFTPFYFAPANAKLQQLAIDMQRLDTEWEQFSQGWLGIGIIYMPLRIALTTIYWILQVRMIFRGGKLQGGYNLVAENRRVMIWTKIFCGSQVLFFLPYYLNIVIGSRENAFFIAHIILALSVSITILTLLLHPDILYGLKGVLVKDQRIDIDHSKTILRKESRGTAISDTDEVQIHVVNVDTPPTTGNPEPVYLSAEKLSAMGKQLEEHILRQHTYLKKGCTSAGLAAEMNIQPYVLSTVINQVFKTNFNDFLNRYRVDHAKTLIQNGQAKMLTLEGLSEQCGFNNRNSFTIAFKKHTGQTPSDFIKQAAASAT